LLSNATCTATYWYRWFLFHAHSVKTPEGFYVITEFLPEVFWAGPHNTISCPAVGLYKLKSVAPELESAWFQLLNL
jgi:hypothetical protein